MADGGGGQSGFRIWEFDIGSEKWNSERKVMRPYGGAR